ncbi:hypothetical protein GCM10011408_22380 [Dyella caseinilytica]|nr:hypothetical protein GCM10011408_22380 [Dyella caseinilytica]
MATAYAAEYTYRQTMLITEGMRRAMTACASHMPVCAQGGIAKNSAAHADYFPLLLN